MSNVDTLNNVILQFSRYVPIPILIFGLIGNILNIFIFTRRSQNKNPCSMYFLSSTIVNINVLLFGCLVRGLVDAFNIDLASANLPFCRIRYYIVNCSLTLSSWFTLLAGIDRYCVSSPDHQRRRLSNRKYARFLIFVTTMIFLILYSHVLGLYKIEQSPTGPNCDAQDGAYRIFYDFFYFATFSFTPPILMIIVGLATFRNIRQIRARVNPQGTASANASLLKKRDRQLITMLLAQLIITIICTLPIAIHKLYATFTQYMEKDDYRLTVENLIVQITRQLTFLNCGISFYL